MGRCISQAGAETLLITDRDGLAAVVVGAVAGEENARNYLLSLVFKASSIRWFDGASQ